MPIFTGVSARARIGSGAAIAHAVHAKPVLSTERRPIRCARDDVDFRIVGFKLSAPSRLDDS
jgi:hypothetical protein